MRNVVEEGGRERTEWSGAVAVDQNVFVYLERFCENGKWPRVERGANNEKGTEDASR